jgi:ABC-type Mn2+/Zn2+ transport system permease subunit
MTLESELELARFLWPSLLTAAAVALAGAPTGAIVMLRRESLFALALPQVVAAGLAFGLRYHLPPWLPAVFAVLLTLCIVAWARRKHRADALIPAIYVAGIAGSILLIAHSGQHLATIQNLFTGLDVAVTETEAKVAVPLLLLFVLPVVLLWRRWLLLAQAPTTAQIAGLRPANWHLLFLTLLSSIILLATDMLGTILIMTMLLVPSLAALPWARRLPDLMLLSAGAAVLSLAAGFHLSAQLDWPFSHSTAAAALLLVLLSHTIKGITTWYLSPVLPTNKR